MKLRIRDLREDNDLKQKEIADYYQVSVDYLLSRTNTKRPYPKKVGANCVPLSKTTFMFPLTI